MEKLVHLLFGRHGICCDRSFEIKKIVGKHLCIRIYIFGALQKPYWISKHYLKEFIANPNMKLDDFKYNIQKIFCMVNKIYCRRANIRIQTMIEGNITKHYKRL